MVGDNVGKAYSVVAPPVIASEHVFFQVRQAQKEGSKGLTFKCWVWVDGKLIGPEDKLGQLAVAPDGKRVAYWTHPGWSTAPPRRRRG